MSRISDQSDKDLEKGIETCDETSVETSEEECDGQEIQLLEDSPNGKLVYFSSPYFHEVWFPLSIFTGLICAMIACTVQLLCSVFPKFYYDYQTKASDLLSPLWLTWPIVSYFLYFFMVVVFYIHDREDIYLDTKALRKLLEEVAEMDLMGGPEAWRRIAFRVNKSFMEKKYNSSIFYSGEQCRWVFVREIVKPIDSGTWDIRCPFDKEQCRAYFQNPSNRKLAERAVANYKKSIEDIGDLSDIDEKNDQSDRLFKKFYDIVVNITSCVFGIEMAIMVLFTVAFFIWTAYCTVFHLIPFS